MGVDVCAGIPEFLFGVQVGVKEEVHSQLETLFGHRLVVWMLQLCLQHTQISLSGSHKLITDDHTACDLLL